MTLSLSFSLLLYDGCAERARGGAVAPGGVFLSVDAYQFLIMTLTEQYVIATKTTSFRTLLVRSQLVPP